ncbi:maltokinase N-terminal cap-like domain-containing protein [Streptomyces flavofungini]|uniref:maltokinase N-terminal cap-like domain-containing protein n=1 Tax=Streptomyces flavofungini TaxID=68200 RepID=UPI0025AFE3AB|nr:maltokinase [Streptomyces flavofungini]WJV46071.1 maltokinase [Streptomyces flavofungini]
MSEAAIRPSADPGALLASLDPLLRGWLPRQRWFAGKGRPVTGFDLVAATELLPPGAEQGLLHLLVRVRQSLPGATPAAEHELPSDCYQLLLGVRTELPPRLAPALIGHVTGGALAGRTVYEALHDPRTAGLLLERLRLPGRLGVLRFLRARGDGGAAGSQDPAVAGNAHDIDIPSGLVPRALGVEQSNSSLVYGDTFILKLFRRVVPGVNPDLELPLALAAQGCRRVPPPVAWMTADGTDGADEPLVLGVLQPYVAGATDGWELALQFLAKGADFSAEARALGRATAEVHAALAAALPTVTLGRAQVELLARGMAERLDAAAQAVPALRPYAPALHTAYDALADLAAEGDTRLVAQRVHGDLHLGQCLRAPSGSWSLIDFEGEPARPLAERRLPQPTARDVAGMLRSFDYAARVYRPWSPEWADTCRAAYCSGYADVSGRDPRTSPVLLRAHETDKAVYEAVYEARHRPDWLPVPLTALDRLAAGSEREGAADPGTDASL